jgi:anti-anti-sigma factor
MLETKDALQATLLKVPGNINEHEADLQATINQAMANNKKHILLNLSDVAFADSSGLGVLVSLFKKVKAGGGTLAFYGVQPYIQKLVELTKLNRVLSIYETEEAAIASIK